MKPLLICTDFDGTLADERHEIPFAPAFFGWLEREKRQREITWVINTGRNWEELASALENRQSPWPDWAVLLERYICKVENRQPAPFQSWNNHCDEAHQTLFQKADPVFASIQAELSKKNGIYFRQDGFGSPLEFVVKSEEQGNHIDAFLEPFLKEMEELVCVRNTTYFRFAHRDFHKGSCLDALSRRLDIPPSQCFAAGDHHNDLPMLQRQYAHHMACPSNAAEAVKQHLSSQTGSYIAQNPTYLGVVEALEHFFPSEA